MVELAARVKTRPVKASSVAIEKDWEMLCESSKPTYPSCKAA